MKTYLLISLLFCVLSNFIYAQNQNCGQNINCDPTKAYPYILCNKAIECRINPSIGTPKVMKAKRIPICLVNVPKDGPPNEVFMLAETGGVGLVFSMTEVPNDIECAQTEWDCICGKQNEDCKCHIELRWSKDTKDFDDATKILASAKMTKGTYTDGTCCAICPDDNAIDPKTGKPVASFVIVNNTTEFTMIKDNLPRKAFVNKNVDFRAAQYNHTFNLCDVLAHEIAHLYGLDHYQECKPYTGASTGIMNETISADLPLQGLTDDDKCMFARLYCNAVHVEDSDSLFSKIQVKTYPTPTQNTLNIEFTINGVAVDLIFQVFSESGKLVYDNGYFYTNQGLNRITEDFSFLTNGNYYFKIYSEENVFSGKFVIAK